MDGTLPMGHADALACRIANAAAGFGLSASALYAGPACPRNANAFAIEKSATEIQPSNDGVIVAPEPVATRPAAVKPLMGVKE
jgi:hypothetical protein